MNPRKLHAKTLLSFLQKTPAAHCWNKVGLKRHYGVCLPLSSIHSENSCGIGEFNDLIPLILWCRNIGFDTLQLLPVNDCGQDTSPYNCISAFALNPTFLSLTSLPEIDRIPNYKDKIKQIQQLTLTVSIKHRIVKNKKEEFLKEYYSLLKNNLENDEGFQKFKQEQYYWLFSYTLFRSLKETRHWSHSKDWPEKFSDIKNTEAIATSLSPLTEFHAYLQYLCFLQLSNVKKIALKNGVFLKGDIPILVSRDSCDTWYYKDFFIHRNSAGSPPDAYNDKGQNWEFPLYNWDAIKKTDFEWWKNRVYYAENFYSLYRLDHISGFFRIWALDHSQPDQHFGRFIPETVHDWITQGSEILKVLLSSSDMLPIGEDLGMVPKCIKDAIKNLGICGTAVPRWERAWENNGDYIPLSQYSPLSMTSLSTHDSDTLALWWTNNPGEASLFAKANGLTYSVPLSHKNLQLIIQKTFSSPSLFHINLINDYLALNPKFISKDPLKERINRPGTISHLNWVYRLIPSVEELLNADKFNAELQSLIPKNRSDF